MVIVRDGHWSANLITDMLTGDNGMERFHSGLSSLLGPVVSAMQTVWRISNRAHGFTLLE
jgi:hypothetical protein